MNTYHKICSKCKTTKSTTEFSPRKSGSKDGLNTVCKSCKSEYQRQFQLKNSDSRREYQKEYREKNKKRLQEQRKSYREINSQTIAEKRRISYLENREEILAERKDYYENNKESIISRVVTYQRENKESRKKFINEWHNSKCATDDLFKLRHNIRTLIRNSIKHNGSKKTTKAMEILGCSYEEFKTHIENQFMEGMSWDNRSEWHLDHITPISWGKTEEEIVRLNHYTNFQPLWARDNIQKGNRFKG